MTMVLAAIAGGLLAAASQQSNDTLLIRLARSTALIAGVVLTVLAFRA